MANNWIFQSVQKQCVWAVAITTMVIIIMFNYNLNFDKSLTYFIPKSERAPSKLTKDIQQSEDNTSVCHFPDLDPWHPSLAAYVTNTTVHVVCPQTQPNLTHVDMQGFLHLNQSALYILIDWLNENGTNIEINCFYWTFDRALGLNDNQVAYSSKRPLNNETSPVALDQDMVEVICYKNTSKKGSIYWNLHAHPANKSDRIFNSPTDTQLSVLMLGIDSISYSLFRRRMPLTLDYVVNKMGMHLFTKMNKVGANSYPNLMVMFTGKRAAKEQADMLLEMDSYTEHKFDSAPLIWRYFAAKGYATVFNEDWSNYGTFHYFAHGFAKKPVDYYYHMFWKVYDWNYKTRYCIANRPTGETHVDIVRRHVITMKDTLQFGFHFFTDYSHNYYDDVNQGDEDYLNFFQETFKGVYLNKTVVLFFGDHGHRFSSIRKTLIGAMEEHNPFFGIWFPEWFYKQHPHLKKVLQQNVDKYTSTFDIHETLKDILDEDFDTVQQHPKSKRGLSLLRNLPEKRSCKQAGVPDRFCLCKEEKLLEINGTQVNNATDYVISVLNRLLEPLFMKCQKIELLSILGATSVNYDQDWGDGHDHLNKIRLILLTKPNDAIFEAFLGKRVKNNNGTLENEWMLLGEIERISQYGNSADCIRDKWLRKFCTCIKV